MARCRAAERDRSSGSKKWVSIRPRSGKPWDRPKRTNSTFCVIWRITPRFETRRERAEKLVREQEEFLASFGPDARKVLDAVIEKYAEHGSGQLKLPDVLEVPPLSEWGNVIELSARFRRQ